MPSNSILLDNIPLAPVRKTVTPREYPFAHLGDTVTATYTATYLQRFDCFAPFTRGAADPENPGFYCIAETKPRLLGPSDVQGVACTFQRTYASLPTTQTDPSATLIVNRPSPNLSAYPGTFGAYRIFKPDTTLNKFDVYLAKTVAADTGAPSLYPSGGTYPLTFNAATTSSLNYNDSASTVQTALNALSTISDRGGVTVSGSYNIAAGFTVTFATYAYPSFSLGSLTGSFSSISAGGSNLNAGYTKTVAFTVPSGTISGGTFTSTIFGQTTGTIAYNASPATVAATFNALSEVQTKRGGVTVSIPSGQTTILAPDAKSINFTLQFSSVAITGDATSLTPTGSSITVSYGSDPSGIGIVQTIHLAAAAIQTRTLYVPGGHDIASTDTLYLRVGSSGTYYSAIAPGAFTVPDANSIALVITSSLSYASAGTLGEIGRRTRAAYTPGSAAVAASLVTRFSLSALTPDTYQGDDASFLQAIFSGSPAINYRVGDSTRWPAADSPIRSITTTVLDAANL